MPLAGPEPSGVRGGARTTQRRGRMTEAKRSALRDLGVRWILDVEAVAATGGLATAFGRAAPIMVDIGGGTGEATLAWALDHPDRNVLAVEVHRPGLVRLLRALDAGGPPNVRGSEADATTLLGTLPAGSIAQVRVLFPDPWPKRRHVGRRLVEPGFVRRAADLLEPGGVLHLATDWPDYADQMRASVATDPRLRPDLDGIDGAGPVLPGTGRPVRWWSHRPDRPVTVYEQRGLDAGRPIKDLIARRVDR